MFLSSHAGRDGSFRRFCLTAAIVPMLSLGGFGCGAPRPTQSDRRNRRRGRPRWFEDVTDAVGLDFVHDPGPTGTYFMPQSMGSGARLLPRRRRPLDLYLLQNGGPDSKSVNRLYRREPDGKFQDVTAGSGLDVAGYNMGVAVGDVNNDGRPDVLLTQYGGVKLFLNHGGGTFEDVTAEAGLSNPLLGACPPPSSTTTATAGSTSSSSTTSITTRRVSACRREGAKDYCGPNTFPGTCSKLFHNRGPAGGGRQAGRVVSRT